VTGIERRIAPKNDPNICASISVSVLIGDTFHIIMKENISEITNNPSRDLKIFPKVFKTSPLLIPH